MPYELVKRDGRWQVRNKETGKVKGRHDSKIKAQRQINLLRGVEHSDWRPTGKAARK